MKNAPLTFDACDPAGAGPRRSRSAAARAALALCAMLALPVTATATVGIAITATNTTPIAGGSAFAYTVTLTNQDTTSPATSVVMTLPLPPNILLANNNPTITESSPVAPPSGTRGFFSCTTPAQQQNGTVTCTADSFPASTMAITTTAQISITVQAQADMSGGVRTATARVVANGVSAFANQQVTVSNNASLLVSKTGPSSATRGSTIAYALTLSNTANSSAVNVTVSDTLPSTTTFVSVTGAGAMHNACAYDPSTNVVQCVMPFVATGAHRATLVLKTTGATPLGTLSNTATVVAAVGTIQSGGASTANTTINP